ncbi:unnamed protein product [Spodoptera littoralis]|uniref:Uncharacterized protein n=1 Tax=Spodoptera littoralis TaxID=7109 RepID=A0A9P0N5G3_SPOLI|nr:unnamed protein product [Spodoptera littoralis]CAH1642228.1 unnamed protein product [Spodoptera littoralis]
MAYAVNEQTDHLMISNRRRPWTPEALQVRYRPFGNWKFEDCVGFGDWGD